MQNAPQIVCWPGFAQTHLGSSQHFQAKPGFGEGPPGTRRHPQGKAKGKRKGKWREKKRRKGGERDKVLY